MRVRAACARSLYVSIYLYVHFKWPGDDSCDDISRMHSKYYDNKGQTLQSIVCSQIRCEFCVFFFLISRERSINIPWTWFWVLCIQVSTYKIVHFSCVFAFFVLSNALSNDLHARISFECATHRRGKKKKRDENRHPMCKWRIINISETINILSFITTIVEFVKVFLSDSPSLSLSVS